MNLILFSSAIIFLFTIYHAIKILLKLITWILMKTVFKVALKQNEEERIKNIQFLRTTGIEIIEVTKTTSKRNLPENYTCLR